MTTVLHLVGSPTDAFFDDLSRLYAQGCLDAIGATGRHVVAHVSPDGGWRFPASLDTLEDTAPMPMIDALARMEALRPDVALPQLFCRTGMTTYRALLDALGIAFIGNRAETMALGAHKPRARSVVAAAGVAVPDGVVVRREEAVPDIGLPVVVKPADADNSEAVTLVRDSAELPDALEAAWRWCPEALVERYVPLGREVRCGVLERGGELIVLPLEEYAVDTDRKPVRLASDKLARGARGRLELVAKDVDHAWIVASDDPVNAAVAEAARAAHRALGCRHYSLFDFRIDPQGRPWFLEAGLYCSFAASSVVAVMARAAGIPTERLFAELVASVS